MTALIVLSFIFLYALIGGIIGQVWDRVARKDCYAYSHDFFCDHTPLSYAVGLFWPVVPALVLAIIGVIKLSGAIANFFVKED